MRVSQKGACAHFNKVTALTSQEQPDRSNARGAISISNRAALHGLRAWN